MRSGYLAAKRTPIGAPVEVAQTAVFSMPAASSTMRRSSAYWSTVGSVAMVQSDLPLPRTHQLTTLCLAARSSSTKSHWLCSSAKPPISASGEPEPVVSYHRWMPF